MKRALLACILTWPLAGQNFSQRGFFEVRTTLFPQTTPQDSGRVILDSLLRYEMSYKLTPWLRFQGAVDGRTDTHHLTERRLRLDWQDRGAQRPAVSLRRFSLTADRGPWTVEAGRQFIRWGKADILNPLDRFAPRDFLNVVDPEYLGVLAGRVTWERGPDTLELVWQPRFTPSRTPIPNQRWAPLPDIGIPLREGPPRLPGGDQVGLRWNHVGRGYEASGVLYQGHNHLPLLDARITEVPVPSAEFFRYFAQMRMIGGAAAVPNRWFTLKSEAGFFSSSTPGADNYLQYVIQAERQSGEWTFVGGYAGEYVTVRRRLFDFAPDRGLTRSFLGRASLQINPNDSVSFDVAVRQNGSGVWIRNEYVHLLNDRFSVRLSGALIRGDVSDFLGQFRRNSHVMLVFRYSF